MVSHELSVVFVSGLACTAEGTKYFWFEVHFSCNKNKNKIFYFISAEGVFYFVKIFQEMKQWYFYNMDVAKQIPIICHSNIFIIQTISEFIFVETCLVYKKINSLQKETSDMI